MLTGQATPAYHPTVRLVTTPAMFWVELHSELMPTEPAVGIGICDDQERAIGCPRGSVAIALSNNMRGAFVKLCVNLLVGKWQPRQTFEQPLLSNH